VSLERAGQRFGLADLAAALAQLDRTVEGVDALLGDEVLQQLGPGRQRARSAGRSARWPDPARRRSPRAAGRCPASPGPRAGRPDAIRSSTTMSSLPRLVVKTAGARAPQPRAGPRWRPPRAPRGARRRPVAAGEPSRSRGAPARRSRRRVRRVRSSCNLRGIAPKRRENRGPSILAGLIDLGEVAERGDAAPR
jgi:hypothetical protein